MIRKSIAWCVLTYNNPDVVYDVWESNIYKYKNMGIDVYFFDSSTNEQTKELVDRYINYGFDNVHYIYLNSDITYDEKLMYVISQYKFEYDYQYIWPVKDRTCISYDLYRKVLKIMEKKYSVIFIGAFDYGINKKRYDDVYVNPVEFYNDWGYLVTSLDVCIYNMDIIRKINWDKFKLCIRWNRDYAFTQYALAMYILMDKENQVYSLDKYSVKYFYNSSKGNSKWGDKLIKIWVQRWYEANIWLPDEFGLYRESVMKKATSLPWVLGSMNVIADLCINNRLRKDDVKRVKNIWSCVCELPYYDIELMVEHRYDEVKNLIYKNVIRQMEKGNVEAARKIYINNEWIGKVCNVEEYVQVGTYLKKME